MICIPPRRRKLFFFLFGAALMRESLYVNIGRCICLQWPNGTERVNTNKMAAAGMWIDLCKPIYHAFYFCVKRWHASWHSKLAYETVNVCDEFKSGFVCILPYRGRFVLFPGLPVSCRSSRSAWGTQMHVISTQHELCIQKTHPCVVTANWSVRIIVMVHQQSSCV